MVFFWFKGWEGGKERRVLGNFINVVFIFGVVVYMFLWRFLVLFVIEVVVVLGLLLGM